MNYKKQYQLLIEKAKNRKLPKDDYKEKHHIIPKCMNGNNNKENLVELTAKEHYVAHHLLVEMYKNTLFISKLICAFRFMSVDSHNGNRIGLNDYENMKKFFSKHHPMKQKNIREKVSKSLKTYYENESLEKKKHRIERSKLNYKTFYSKLSAEEIIKYKEKFNIIVRRNMKNPENIKKIKEGIKKYYENETIEQKNIRLEKQNKAHTKKCYEKVSKSLKKHINNLTKKEKEERLNKSLRNCDSEKRGKSISKGKKGKKTNQQEIMGKKYAKMSDDEFKILLNSKNKRTHKRMTNLRNKYLNKNE